MYDWDGEYSALADTLEYKAKVTPRDPYSGQIPYRFEFCYTSSVGQLKSHKLGFSIICEFAFCYRARVHKTCTETYVSLSLGINDHHLQQASKWKTAFFANQVGRIGVLALAHFARRRMPGFSKFLEFVAVLPVNLAYLSYTYKILRYIFEESASDFLSKN